MTSGDLHFEHSFTRLIAQTKASGLAIASERDRLREIVQTLHVNALRCTSDEPLVSFMRTQLGEMLAGKSMQDAIRDFDIAEKHAHLAAEAGEGS